MAKDIWADFNNPGSRFRGMPFWAWNGKLDPEELKRQIRIMKRMGLGGFFMHSRVGLDTAYLSEEWFSAVRACVDEARRLGMQAWLYDEDRWPSGAAGGFVTRDERYRRRFLAMEEHADARGLKWTDDVVAVFTARVDGPSAAGVRPVARGTKPNPSPGQRVLVFRLRLEEPSLWFNGFTYLDTLNPKAVKRFITVTHEAYRKRFSDELGRTIPGIFTDEPNYGHTLWESGSFTALPWTDALPVRFKTMYGYDIVPRIPELYFDVDGKEMTPARLHFHDCLTRLFTDSFSRQIGEWCEKYGMAFTGHVLEEDTLSRQTDVAGSAMRFYEHMQAPGMDLLTERWRIYLTAKQLSSAARQFGRTWRVTETYGCTGWDFPLSGHKALGDWQAALGVNLRCQHLFWYTMEADAKRDYPASISHASPWWELYSGVEDYFARINAVMTRGHEVRDLLVIHPVESAWSLMRKGWHDDPRVQDLDASLMRVEACLLSAHIDFDYGDEEILARLAVVKKAARGAGAAQAAPTEPAPRAGAARLHVGKADYSAILVPPMRTMRKTTLALLERFRAAGGLVVFAGEPASFVEGVSSDEARRLAECCVRSPASGPGLAASTETCRRLSITDEAGSEIGDVLSLLREDGEAFMLFMCNTGVDPLKTAEDVRSGPPVSERTAAYPVVRVKGFGGCEGAPLELDPQDGALYTAEAVRAADGDWRVSTSFPALGSRLFMFPKKAARARPKDAGAIGPRRHLAERSVRPLDVGEWEIALSEPNVLVLDRPAFAMADGAWEPPMEALRLDRELRRRLGIPLRGRNRIQPWLAAASRRAGTPGEKESLIRLRYTFTAEAAPSGPLYFALEQPGRYTISVNGFPLDPEMDCGWWVDGSLRKIQADPALIRVGENVIELSCRFGSGHPGLEIVYLLGTFGARAQGGTAVMGPAPRTLKPGDWTSQGLAFYSGSVVYRTVRHVECPPENRVFIRVPRFLGAAVRVIVNGQAAGAILWEPHEVEITHCLRGSAEAGVSAGSTAGRASKGDSGPGATADIRIEVIGHRRNSHGPLHLAVDRPEWTGPDQFAPKDSEWTDSYHLVACGLMEDPLLVVKA